MPSDAERLAEAILSYLDWQRRQAETAEQGRFARRRQRQEQESEGSQDHAGRTEEQPA